MEKITQYLIQSTVHGSEVRAWEEDIMLPTYEIGEEEKNPIFLEKRVYQGRRAPGAGRKGRRPCRDLTYQPANNERNDILWQERKRSA